MGKSQGTQKTTTETKLPAWYDTAAQNAIAFADTAADTLAKPYTGDTVAPLDPLQQQAVSLTGQNIGSTNPAFTQAGQTAANAQGFTPGSFLSGDFGAYMNPYLQQVEQNALGNMGRAYRQNLNTIADQSMNAGAFGGSRQGVAEGVAASEYARQMGDLSAQLRSEGYGQAVNMMESDMNRQMAGQELNLRAAGLQGDLATAGQAAYLQSLQSALSAGQINQDQAQALLAQDAARYDANRNYPLEQLNLRLAALGGTQVPTSSTVTRPTSGNWLTGAAGGAMAGMQFGPWGALAGGALGGLSTLSDERMKTNIEPLGIDSVTGLPMYAYDYKSDLENSAMTGAPMPGKRVGPMAQDMPPDMVREVGGVKVITDSSRVAPEGMEYMTTGSMDPYAYTPASMLGWLFGAQDWKENYPRSVGMRGDLPPGLL